MIILIRGGQAISEGNLHKYLDSRLLEHLTVVDQKRKATLFVHLGIDLRNLAIRFLYPRKSHILIVEEPISVAPLHHSKMWQLLFLKILVRFPCCKDFTSSGGRQRLEHGALKLDRYTRLRDSDEQKAFAKQIGIVNANKYSFVRQAQYHLRIDAIRSMSRAGWTVTVAGRGWNRGALISFTLQGAKLLSQIFTFARPTLSFFRGPLVAHPNIKSVGFVEDEVAFLSQFPFSLVTENCQGCVSEKVFNALIALSVPICVDPSGSLREALGDSTGAIFVRSISDLTLQLESLDSQTYRAKQEQMRLAINSKSFVLRHSKQNYIDSISREIRLICERLETI